MNPLLIGISIVVYVLVGYTFNRITETDPKNINLPKFKEYDIWDWTSLIIDLLLWPVIVVIFSIILAVKTIWK